MRIEFAASQTLTRVAIRLVELAHRYGEPSDGEVVIDLPISQEELAGWTGSSREAVAKALHTLREMGLIVTDRRRITVTDLDGLRRQAA
jgi:CRP/FNR family transcriptional regulator, cyclic AMP receptor protein